MEAILGLLLFSVILAFYFLPCIIAATSNHRQRDAIGILNFFLGWTLIGWVIALVWATVKEK